MNIDRGKESFTDDEIASVRQQLKDFKDANGHSWKDLEKLIGDTSGAVLSAFVNATYNGDNRNTAWKINRFFVAEEARAQQSLVMPVVPGFRMTKTAQMMTAQMRWAHEGEISTIMGNPGLSKTATIDQYVGTNPNVFKITGCAAIRSVAPVLTAIAQAAGRDVKLWRTSSILYQNLVARLTGIRALIIVDEAQHLRDDALDQLRAIHDQTKCGLLLAGNHAVMGRMDQDGRAVSFAQFQSRVSWPQTYLNALPEDIAMLLDAWEVENAREREFLGKVAMMPGALRNLTQVLKMATLDARSTEEDRTLSHLTGAWQQLRRQQQIAA